MDPRAVTKAQTRLRNAKRAFNQMRAAQNLEDYMDHWVSFLSSWKGILIAIGLGSRDNSSARTWYGEKKRERKDNPLLQYLFQARNDEEHGLDSSVEMSLGSFLVEIPDSGKEGRQISFSYDPQTGEAQASRPDGGPLKLLRSKGAGPHLKTVTARDGEVFGAPLSHAGVNIDGNPITAAELGIKYVEELIAEAQERSKP
ncbi:MAG: hypothetical protein AAFO74_02230 [Pseudomonadota bacterium]